MTWDENDPMCKEKDPDLYKKISQKGDHIFTFLLNCAHYYLQKKLRKGYDLMAQIPKRFQREWQELQASGTLDPHWDIFKEFVAQHCVKQKDSWIYADKFISDLNSYAKKKQYVSEIAYNRAMVKEYVKCIKNDKNDPLTCNVIRKKFNNDDHDRDHAIIHLCWK